MARKNGGKAKRDPAEPEVARPRADVPAPAGRHGPGATRALRNGVGAIGTRGRKAALAAALFVAAVAAGLVLLRFYGPAGRAPVILVSVDTLRADRLPMYGYRKIQTPAFDALARDGAVFENAYTHVPLTLPAHTSLFTGQLPPVHGVRNNIGFKVAAGARTLAAELKKAGYSTGGAVSAHVLHSTTGISQGFDWYDDDLKATDPALPATEIQRDGTETLARALAWLTDRSKEAGVFGIGRRPFFLFLHLYEPHTPYAPPQRFQRADRAPYDGEVAYSDEILGSFLARLRELDLYDDSLVILLSDHGEALGDHGESDHGVFLYREVMRVPLVIKLPGNRGGGRRIQAPVQLVDVAPTVFDQAGLPQSPQAQGKSLLPALEGRAFPDDRRVYAESLYGRLHFGWKELFSLTSLRYSFILAPRPELYDIRQDPGQVHDLLARGPAASSAIAALPEAVAAEYERLHRALRSQVGQSTIKAPDPVDEEELRKLRALGYIGSPSLESNADDSAPDPKDRIGDLALYRQAVRMKGIGLYSRVAATLEEVVETSPRMIDAWDELSAAYQRLGDFEKAAEALRRSLRISPRRTRQLFQLVDLLVQLRRYDDAREHLRLALHQAPDEAEARRAFLEVVAGKPEAARDAAARAARGLPSAVPFVEGLLLYGSQEYSKAIPPLRKAVEGLRGRSPETLPHVHFYLGDALVRESLASGSEAAQNLVRQEAEKLLQAELTLNPTSASAVTSLCYLHATGRDLRKVHDVLNGFARENPSPATYEFIAGLYARMKLNEDATRWSARARLGPGK